MQFVWIVFAVAMFFAGLLAGRDSDYDASPERMEALIKHWRANAVYKRIEAEMISAELAKAPPKAVENQS